MVKKMRFKRVAAVIATLVLGAQLAACSGGLADRLAGVDASSVSVAPEMMVQDGQAVSESLTVMNTGRSIISSGGITIEVEDVKAQADAVAQIARDLGGYVESQNIGSHGTLSYENASLSIRVPADKFDAAFAEMSELGNVLDENRSASDVTAQHVDLQARVKALEASIERLTELMTGAATTGELIEAESALSARQAELDGLTAQLDALENQVNEATIWVSLTTASAIPGGPANFWEGLIAGLNSLWAAGAGALVLLGVLIPWLVIAAIITLVVVWIVKGAKRRKTHHLDAQAKSAAETKNDLA